VVPPMLSRLLLLAAVALAAGCAARASSIPGTKIANDKINRDVIETVESYRIAVEKADAESLFLMASDRYFEDSGTPQGSDDYGYDGLKDVLVGRFMMARDIRYAMRYVSVKRTCAEGEPTPGCRAHVEVMVDASFTIVDSRGKDRRTDKRDQNELVLELASDGKWKFVSGM
jgi:hypothetical protein